MAKPGLSADQLTKKLLERIEAIADLRDQVTDVHRAGVRWMDPGDEGGPNWCVPVLTDRGTHRSDIARIVREMQMHYDLDE